VARFNSVYAAYAQAPEVTRQRMYIETIEQILRDSQKIMLDTKGGAGGNMIYLPLDRLLERNGARGAAPSAPEGAAGAQALPELPPVTVDGRARGSR
jgi:membrane protease subunit HflK